MIRRRWPAFTRFDARAWRGLAVSLALITGAGLVFVLGARALGPDGSATARRWLSLARGPWALPASVAVFAVLAFVGVPQLLLIAAAVVVFGPALGAAYSWVGTLISSLIGFGAGRLLKPRLVDRSPGVQRYCAMIARNGFWATLVIRLAPVAPFILVNLAGGASGVGVVDFVGGTAIGIVPKIALTAIAGRSTLRALQGGGVFPLLLLAAAAILWIASSLLGRRLLRRQPP